MGSISTLIYASELILCSTIQVENNLLSLQFTEWNKEKNRITISFESKLQYLSALIAFSCLLRMKNTS